MPIWVDNNWVWQLLRGLPEADLERVMTYCHGTIETQSRLAWCSLVLFEKMAQKTLITRGALPGPFPPVDDPWPSSNWVWQLFQGMENNELQAIVTTCQRADINMEARVSHVLLIMVHSMADELLGHGMVPPF